MVKIDKEPEIGGVGGSRASGWVKRAVWPAAIGT